MILTAGNKISPKVVVVCDVPTQLSYSRGQVMPPAAMGVFRESATEAGFDKEDFLFLTCSSPIPESESITESKISKYLETEREDFLTALSAALAIPGVKLLIYAGKYAGQQVMGHAIKITLKRGQIHNEPGIRVPVLPILSPGNVLRRPQEKDTFRTDLALGGAFKAAGWTMAGYTNSRTLGVYKWATTLAEAGIDINNPPEAMSVDTETVGLKWYDPSFRVLTIQLSWEAGQGVCFPVDIAYFNNPDLRGESTKDMPLLTEQGRTSLLSELRVLFANPRVAFVGHHTKFDLHALANLDLYIANWLHDTLQLAFVADDNMQIKSLDECVRRYVSDLAGYADTFNKEVDKSRMDLVPHDKMLEYSCGDTDATLRLCFRLVEIAMEDERNFNCYTKVQMPALREFFRMEREGIAVNTEQLTALGNVVSEQIEELKASLLSQVSGEVKRRQLEKNPGKPPEEVLSFTRADFLIDILFTPKGRGGRGHRPVVFTKGTRRLDGGERIPSTSAKEHLAYFEDDPFVADLIDLVRLFKLKSTYIGQEAGAELTPVKRLKNGKWQKAAQDVIDRHQLPAGEARPPRRRVPGSSQPPPSPYYAEARVDELRKLVILNDGTPAWEEASDDSGFWKYLDPESNIHPGFQLDKTVTGRSSSNSPNGQNIPKRGRTPRLKTLVKTYRKIFTARPGWKLIEADLSQAELRIIAWHANERTMLSVYREGGDIHATTAAKTLGITKEEFALLPDDDREMSRYQSKAINFGFALQGITEVLTDKGSVQIRDLTTDHLLWDGMAWVTHRGVFSKGIRKGILYQGLGATRGHIVFTDRGACTIDFARRHGWNLCHCNVSNANVIFWYDSKDIEIYRAEESRSLADKVKDYNFGATLRYFRSLDLIARGKEATGNEEVIEVEFFDIMDAGPEYRFTVSGIGTVTNCFGMWWKKFIAYARTDYGITLTEAEAEKVYNDYFELYSGLKDWHKGMKWFAEEHGYVRALHGALRRLPAIHSSDEGIQKEAGRQAINSSIQRFASDIGLMGMATFSRYCPWDRMHPLGFIHDATVIEAREDSVEEACSAIRWILENPPLEEWFGIRCPIPILADVAAGSSLGELDKTETEAVRPLWLPERFMDDVD